MRLRNGNDRRANGSRPRPSSPLSSARGSSANDETGLAHRIPDSPEPDPSEDFNAPAVALELKPSSGPIVVKVEYLIPVEKVDASWTSCASAGM
ncbi:MFS transporter [Mesorhizobium sp. M0019]